MRTILFFKLYFVLTIFAVTGCQFAKPKSSSEELGRAPTQATDEEIPSRCLGSIAIAGPDSQISRIQFLFYSYYGNCPNLVSNQKVMKSIIEEATISSLKFDLIDLCYQKQTRAPGNYLDSRVQTRLLAMLIDSFSVNNYRGNLEAFDLSDLAKRTRDAFKFEVEISGLDSRLRKCI